jgi:hypothetical protein
MSANRAPVRLARLVTSMGDELTLWILDASDRDAIDCRTVHFHSREQASLCSHLVDAAIAQWQSIDEVLARAAVTDDAQDRQVFGDPEEIVDFLAGEAEPALRWHARKMLADMAIART